MTAQPAWTTIEDALHAWVVAGSGLSGSQVIWSQQSGARPGTPFVAMRMDRIERLGQDWQEQTINPSSNGHDGVEILQLARGVRAVTLSLQVFAADPTGAGDAVAIAHSIVAAVTLPSIRNALNAAGVGVGSFGPIQSLGAPVDSAIFEPRAHVEARLFITSQLSETDTVIDTVELTDQTVTPNVVFDVTAPS